MTRARRPLTACAAAVALAVALSSCTLFSDSEDEQPVPTVNVPVELPVTFADQARWTVELGTDTRPAVAPEGIAVILPGRTSSSLYRVALVAPEDGSIRWVSDDFENPTPNVVPKVAATTVGGQSWIVVTTQVSANEMQVDSYSPEGTGDRRTPTTTATITGDDDETVPSVSVSEAGVVVSPASDTAMVFNPGTGKATAYDGPGNLSSAWSEGYVITDPSDSSGFGYTVGGEASWQSATSRPSNTDREDKGTLLATGPGILLAEWLGADGNPVLAVHETRTGNVLAVQSDLDPEAVEESRNSALVQSDDGKWASWGQYLFGLKGGPSSEVDLHGGTVRAIYRDVLYVEDATEPLTASAQVERAAQSSEPAPSDGGADATPQPSDSGGAEPTTAATDDASGGAEEPVETFDGMIDAATGDPLTNAEPGAVPLFVSNASQGVFVLSTDGKTRLYSTPLS